MRIATYNVEWFNSLFARDGTLLRDGEWSGRHNVTRAAQADALRHVFTAIDADAIMVIEAPDIHARRDGVAALEGFAKWAGLRACAGQAGFYNETQQEITLLYDPALLGAVHTPHSTQEAPQFDGVLAIDLDIDATPEQVRFSKPPLELTVQSKSTGASFQMIGVHAKSKAPHGARGAEAVMRISIENRRKQLAQCVWLRRRVVEHLAAGTPLIVLGDFNDGPGLDEYERLFGRSGIEVVLGSDSEHPLFDPHAQQAIAQRVGAAPTSARFWLAPEGRYLQALLDYIMVSADLRARGPRWRIWHPFDDPVCYHDPALREALLTASDHFPVTMDIDL